MSVEILSHIQRELTKFTVAIDYDVDDNPIYIGRAEQGSAKSASAWQIRKLTFSGANVTDIQFAEGSPLFRYAWDSRASYTYS